MQKKLFILLNLKYRIINLDTKLNIALLPLEITWRNKEANFTKLKSALEKLHPDTDLLVLPETFSTGYITGPDKEAVRKYAERNTGETISYLRSLSNQYGIAIAGSFIADSGGSLYNRAFFIEPSGEETFADKRHLFTMAGEHEVFSPGFSKMVVRYRGFNLAMAICYDLRFPVWCRNVNNQYDALIVVANWPDVRIGAWNMLLPARAIENEAYCIGVNCKGEDESSFKYGGYANVYDFKGKDISIELDNSPFIYAQLDLEALQRFRKKFPAWADADIFQLE